MTRCRARSTTGGSPPSTSSPSRSTGSYLTTGHVADAIGAGIPALVSPWPFLDETLGAAAIPYGRSAADLAATLDALDDATLVAARAALPERQAALDWTALAATTYGLLDEVAARGATRHPG